MASTPPLHELERRVARDPASVSFALLAEEYRRLGRLDDAIRIARDGLLRHPDYASARVTLGRALMAQGSVAAARRELEAVLVLAPENLAAIRALADLHDTDPGVAPPPSPPGTPALPAWQERQTPTGPFSWAAPDAPRAAPPERHPFFAPRSPEDVRPSGPLAAVGPTQGASLWGLPVPSPGPAERDQLLPDQTVLDQAVPAQMVPDQPIPAEVEPDQTVPAQAVPDWHLSADSADTAPVSPEPAPAGVWEGPPVEPLDSGDWLHTDPSGNLSPQEAWVTFEPVPPMWVEEAPGEDVQVEALSSAPEGVEPSHPLPAPSAPDVDAEALVRLESWLAVVQADRAVRQSMRW